MAAVAAANESDLQAAAAAALEPAPTPAAAAAAADARPLATLDPRLLMAARCGNSRALKDLLHLREDDGNGDEQGQGSRPDDEGSGTPTTAAAPAASTTTSVAAAPSISPPHAIVDVDLRRPHDDAVAAPLPPPPVPVHSEIEQVVEPAPPHDDDAPALMNGGDQDSRALEAAAASEVVMVEVVPRRRSPALALAAAPPPSSSGPAASAPPPLVDGVTTEGDTLLHVVAACGDGEEFLRCAKMIVHDYGHKGGAAAMYLALEARNRKGDTPLHCAAAAGNAKMISCLVDLLASVAAVEEPVAAVVKAFVGRKNKCGETALHQAVRAASKAAIRVLLAVDPELAACSREEDDAGAAAACSPFYLAVSLWGEDGEMDIASYLFHETRYSIRSDVSYYCSRPDGRNVLHAAVSRASVETVVLLSQLLLTMSDDDSVETQTPPGRLLLSQLASQGDKENGSTPLHLAASLGGLPSSRLLPTPRFWSKPIPAVTSFMPSLVLNANVAMAYQPDKAGLYPIHVAAGSGSLLVVKMLLERFPDCATLRDAKGRTLLHVAAEEGQDSVVDYVCWRARRPGLLSSILNAQDINGDTALHRAVHAEQFYVVRHLIRNQQVRLDVPNNVGMRPIDVSWTTMPLEVYYAWDSRILIRRLLLQFGAPYGENNRGDLFRKKCVLSNQDEEKKKMMSENLTAAAQVLALFSVLITTVTFASAFTLPGGSRSSGDGTGVAGTPVLGGPRRSYAFEAFILADALAFGLSLLATSILLYAGVPAGSLDDRFRFINLAYGLMWHSGRSLVAAFGLGLFVVLLPVARSIAIAVAVLMIVLALAIVKESEGIDSLQGIIIPMYGIDRSRQLLRLDLGLVLDSIVIVFIYFWSYILIFGLPAALKWGRFTLSPH